ncbi:MAG: hypothetical protein ACI9OF_000933, partial [Saprospiraceae bacterium]
QSDQSDMVLANQTALLEVAATGSSWMTVGS